MNTETTKVFFKYEENSTTKAIAKNSLTGEEIASREVKLRHGDSPNKLIGRKYAFKKLMNHAMQNNLLSCKEVQALWKEFSSKCKQRNIKLAY